MLNCKETTKLISESLDRKLSLWQKLNLRLHLTMCSICSGFRKSMVHLQQETRSCTREHLEESVNPQVKLPDDAREKMKQLLKTHR